jgi:hypothetical protein
MWLLLACPSHFHVPLYLTYRCCCRHTSLRLFCCSSLPYCRFIALSSYILPWELLLPDACSAATPFGRLLFLRIPDGSACARFVLSTLCTTTAPRLHWEDCLCYGCAHTRFCHAAMIVPHSLNRLDITALHTCCLVFLPPIAAVYAAPRALRLPLALYAAALYGRWHIDLVVAFLNLCVCAATHTACRRDISSSLLPY